MAAGRVIPEALFFSRTRDFLETFLLEQENRSRKTVKAYRDALTVFRRYVCNEAGYSLMSFSFADCTYDFLMEYMSFLSKNQRYAASSVNQRIAAIKSYVRYSADRDVALQQVWFSISRVPLQKASKEVLPIIGREALKALLAAPGDTEKGNRDRMILTLLFDAALRVGELTSVMIRDINIACNEPYLFIHGKGDKERVVGITKRTEAMLQKYILRHHGTHPLSGNYLFFTKTDGQMKQMSERNIERILKKYADEIRSDFPELPATVYPHMLRRTRATGLYRDGVELELISRMLGHSTTEVTRRYAIPSIEMLRAAMEKSPLNEVVEEKPLWEGKENDLIRLCGLRP